MFNFSCLFFISGMKYRYEGLTDQEIQQSRTQFGSNELSMYNQEGFWDKLIGNFKNPIIIILCVALVLVLTLSFFGMTEWYEALAIGTAVVLAVLVSTLSEYKNESSFRRLQYEASQILCNVFRNGSLSRVAIGQLVKGDYLLLQSGDKVPADARMLEGDLKVNQASLNGEPESVTKKPGQKKTNEDDSPYSNPEMIYRGSVVDEGEAVAVVDSVGEKTIYGQLNRELNIKSERLSPLQVKLEELARLISRFGYIAAIIIGISFMFNRIVIAHEFDAAIIMEYMRNWKEFSYDALHAVVLAIIIVVAAVPEGLPMMIAIVLSLNMRKMLTEKVLVRKLLGIETSGSVNILFSDKTGTLTQGKLESRYFLTGHNIVCKGYENIPENLRKVLKLAILENSFSVLDTDGTPIGGNVSERALVNFIPIENRAKFDSKSSHPTVIRFDSSRKFSATEVLGDEDFRQCYPHEVVTLYKGAMDFILPKCTQFIDDEGIRRPLTNQSEINDKSEDLANEGVRLLSIAYSDTGIKDHNNLPDDLTFIGAVGISDELRPESSDAIAKDLSAGVSVVMITGDRESTAIAMAKQMGLFKHEEDIVLSSNEMKMMTDEELASILPNLRVVARALPTDKSRMVRIAQSLGMVVGMTGDGVNDSSALKMADVGFAMGSGSEVAKESGDIVIMDDNFSSITNAIRYGRTIFKSIRKFLIFQLTVNLSAVLTALLGPFFGIEFPLTIIQLLWINIIMDTLAAIAFGGEPALQRYMNEKPIDRNANIISPYMATTILTGGIYIASLSIVFLSVPVFKSFFIRNGIYDQEIFLTGFFNLFIFLILFNGFNARTEKFNLFENIKSNPGFLQVMTLIIIMQVTITFVGDDILRAKPLQIDEWIIVIGLAASIFPVDMIKKLIVRKIGKNTYV
jgi:Ca2+-transporting ATPase